MTKAHRPASPSMGEASRAAAGGGEARDVAGEPLEALPAPTLASPPQSSLRDDSSPIEGEPGRTLARRLRAKLTDAEKSMWRTLRSGELRALNWRRQAPFGPYVLDFVSHPARLVVEVDGAGHSESDQIAHDAKRTAWLESQGYRVERFSNRDATWNADGVWVSVRALAEQSSAAQRLERWRAAHPVDGGIKS